MESPREDVIMTKKLFLIGFFAIALAGWTLPSVADPGRGADVQCYVWAHNPSPTINVPYTPSTTYSYNLVGRATANSVTKTATGTYTVTCKGVGGGPLFSGSGTWGPGGHVQVTAYGGNANYCKVGSWATGGANFSATVRCYNPTPTGPVLSDSQFDLLFVW